MTPDIICGGFPCQDLSVAGKRAGLAGKRSGLFHEFMRIVRELQPALVVIENVPGLVSSGHGHDFRIVLDSLQKLGAMDIAWRTLDSRYFDLAQRRERVFFVADFAGQRAGEILFERPCRCGHPPQGGEAESRVATTIRSRSHGPGVNPPGRGGEDDQNLVTQFFSPRILRNSTTSNEVGIKSGDVADCLQSDGPGAVAFQERGREGGRNLETQAELAYSLNAPAGGGRRQEMNIATFQQSSQAGKGTIGYDESGIAKPCKTQQDGQMLHAGIAVRRLMPVECLRLQGFPDDHLDMDPPLADSPQYRMVGNAVSVPVAEWIARRIRAACPKLRRYLSLFSGIGGFDLGFDRAGLRCVGQVESDPACLRVLARHWPKVERFDDVTTFGVK